MLLVGHIVSTLGSSIYVVTLVLYLVEVTDSPVAIGLLQFFSYLPAALLGPVAGAAVDTWDRRRTIIATDLARGAIMVATATVGLVLGSIPVWLLVVATVGVSLCGVFFVPAVHAIVPDLVDDARLKRANGLRSALSQSANLAGSALGGTLFALLGAPVLILANGVSFVVSGISETTIRPRLGASLGAARSFRGRTREGLRQLRRDRGVRALVFVQASLNLLLPPLVVALPFVITERWGLAPDWFGYLFAAVLAGGIVGFLIASGNGVGPRVESRLYLAGLPTIAVTICVTGIAAMPGVTLPALVVLLPALMAVAGAAIAAMYVIGVTRLQQSVKPTSRGRVFAAMEMITAIGLPAAYLAAGALVEAVGSRYSTVFFVVAGGAALLAVVVLAHRELGSLLAASRRSAGHR